MKRLFKKSWILAIIIPGIILSYVLLAVLISFIPVNSDFQQQDNGIVIFVKSNGVHTDILLPVKTLYMNWDTVIDPKDFKKNSAAVRYLGFGWGDKGFYLYTPTWAELKYSTAFKALFWLGTSAMHVTYYDYIPTKSNRTKKIKISPKQYLRLSNFVQKSFKRDSIGKCILIGCCHYEGQNDNFYDAIGTYNLFFTCNTWTNSALKTAGIKTALWSPFEWSIMHHLQ